MQPRYGPLAILCSLLCAIVLGLGFAVAHLDSPAAPEGVAAVDDSNGATLSPADATVAPHLDCAALDSIEAEPADVRAPAPVAYRDDGLVIWHSRPLDEPEHVPDLGLRSGLHDNDYDSHTLRGAGGRFAGADC